MGQGLDMRINRLLAMTWNWLNMNQTDLSQVEAGDPWHPKIEGVQPEKGETGGDFSSIATGMGPDMDQLAERAGNRLSGSVLQREENGKQLGCVFPVKMGSGLSSRWISWLRKTAL